MDIQATLKAKLHLLTVDLVTQRVVLFKATKAKKNAEQAVEFIQEQINLLKAQLDALSDTSDN